MRVRNLLPLFLLAAIGAAASSVLAGPPADPGPTPLGPPVVRLTPLQLQQLQQLPGYTGPQGGILSPARFPANDGYKSDIQFTGALTPLVNALHSADYAAREEATHTLLRLNANRLPDVRAALEKENDLEAATRLTEVAAHLFLKARTPLDGPGSLLGVKLCSPFELMRIDPADENLHMTLAIAELQPGYPAAQELHVGDRIIAMDGKLFPADLAIDQFRALVTSHPAGTVVPLKIVRDGTVMELGVQVAGLPQVGSDMLDEAIGLRNQVLAAFQSELHSAIKSEPLVFKNESPVSELYQGNSGVIILNNNVQVPGNLQIQGNGVIILNGGGQIILNPPPNVALPPDNLGK